MSMVFPATLVSAKDEDGYHDYTWIIKSDANNISEILCLSRLICAIKE